MSEEVIQISVTNVPTATKEILEKEARRQDRTLAWICRAILIEHAAKIQKKFAASDSTPQAA